MIDPPRKGIDSKSVQNILKIRPNRFVYISCNPATLVRDLAKFEEFYEIKGIQPVDMFPWTGNVEVVCLLSKLKSNKLKRINVELEMDELNLTVAEIKATYEEIKDYVLRQSGL